MTVRSLLVVLVVSGHAAPRAGAGEIAVRRNGATVEVDAQAAPLNAVLERLGKQTGMTVTYEPGAPRPLVTAHLRGQTPAQAVVALLDGQGVDYLVQLDAAGVSVQTLIVVGSGRSGGPQAAAAGAARVARDEPVQEEQMPEPEEMVADEGPAAAEGAGAAQMEAPPGMTLNADPANLPPPPIPPGGFSPSVFGPDRGPGNPAGGVPPVASPRDPASYPPGMRIGPPTGAPNQPPGTEPSPGPPSN